MKKLLMAALFFVIGTLLFAQTNPGAAYTESDITLKTSTGDIFGTLAIPDNIKKSTVVLIIAGSGPTDRNGNSSLGVNCNAYKMIAKGLAENGISTLRFDKRGIAASRAAMGSESDLRFEHYIDDAKAWIVLLKSDNRFDKIFVLGHSEGSLIGMVAASQGGADGYISVAGIARTADQILAEQLKAQLPEPMLNEAKIALDSLKMGMQVAKYNPMLVSLFRPSVQPYLISWFKYNPSDEIKKLKKPVMIVQGTTDIQVSPEEAKLLAAAKPEAKLAIFDGMNHILKEADADRQKNAATYTQPDLPLKSGLVESLVSFIKTGK
jgi:pimeloyl-ACP methyl ester carboxylesterase